MRLIVSFLFLISLSVSSAYGAGIRLENASYNSALSIFAAMTGKTYVGDFKTNKKITYFTEKDISPDEAHAIFESLINTLGGEITKIDNNEFYRVMRKRDDPLDDWSSDDE